MALRELGEAPLELAGRAGDLFQKKNPSCGAAAPRLLSARPVGFSNSTCIHHKYYSRRGPQHRPARLGGASSTPGGINRNPPKPLETPRNPLEPRETTPEPRETKEPTRTQGDTTRTPGDTGHQGSHPNPGRHPGRHQETHQIFGRHFQNPGIHFRGGKPDCIP